MSGQHSAKVSEGGWLAAAGPGLAVRDDFDARAYEKPFPRPQLGRWHAQDPANQFASPYLAMGNQARERVG
jgi:hypothetical protein